MKVKIGFRFKKKENKIRLHMIVFRASTACTELLLDYEKYLLLITCKRLIATLLINLEPLPFQNNQN